ncbi:MAG: hypothetical protein ACTSYD_09860 [Candidatus Heimdallarchaeaceae archaeon]
MKTERYYFVISKNTGGPVVSFAFTEPYIGCKEPVLAVIEKKSKICL